MRQKMTRLMITCTLIFILLTSEIFAAGDNLTVSRKSVTLQENENIFELAFSVPKISPEYAGLQFTLQMSENIKISDTQYNESLDLTVSGERSKGNRVNHTFAFLNDSNIYGDSMTVVTLKLSYAGDADEILEIIDARVSRSEPDGSTTPTVFEPGITIEVSRKGSESSSGGGGGPTGSGGNGGSGGSSSSDSADPDSEIDLGETLGDAEYSPENQNTLVLTDLSGHWAKSEIEEAIALGFVSGYPDGTFKPDQTVTRAEFVRMLVTGLGISSVESADFSDTANHWAASEIRSAAGSGAISGYPDGTFKADLEMSRQELAGALAKAAGLTSSGQGLPFADQASIGIWARESVQALYDAGIMMGNENNEVQPQRSVTRAEAAALILRNVKRVTR